jgi:hypothetical protein
MRRCFSREKILAVRECERRQHRAIMDEECN